MLLLQKISTQGFILLSFSSALIAAEKPNIIVILADDLGFSDIGCYGGEIETPNIDYLASNGLRYRQFYNSARSCPSRATLLTGLYPHQAGMGWMAAADMGRPAYQGYLNRECVTIAEVLKTAGYETYMSGKWHVSSDRQNQGKVIDYWPNQRGFDHYYGIVAGASNYFKAKININNEQITSPDDGTFYLTHAISDAVVDNIKTHDFEKSPMFTYIAYNAPHWPLHALEKDINKYIKIYKSGWDVLRCQRFQRQQDMGLFDSDVTLNPRDSVVPAWNSLSTDLQNEFAMRMAIYAAQIDAMDQGIGRIINSLQEKQQLDNTIIMFMSDNGACAEFISSGKRKEVDGKSDTYESYRINWANLSSTPFKEYKHYTHEGGIASPLIVHFPNGIRKDMNNTFVDEYAHFKDIMATCVDLGNTAYPSTFQGHNITPMEGISLIPNFQNKKTNRIFTFWEHEANIAMRDGKWKLVAKTNLGDEFNPASLELYDMEADPTESLNLADLNPERVSSMFSVWSEWAHTIGVLPMDTRDYGVRAQAYRRNNINGEFNDNFGGWNTFVSSNTLCDFAIDTIHTLSGNKTAKISIIKKGISPIDSGLKWTFNTIKKNSKASISFIGMSEKPSTVHLRIEELGNLNFKPLDKEVLFTDEIKEFVFDNIILSNQSNYQLVFYTGSASSTNWLDKIKFQVK